MENQDARRAGPEHAGYREAMNRGASLVEVADKRLNARADAVIEELMKKVRAIAAVRTGRTRKEQVKK